MKKKQSFKNAIYSILKESINPYDYMMADPYVGETEKNGKEEKGETKDNEGNKRREKVLNFLKSAQQKHSEYAYHLWPDMDEDDARSLFSKKYRGHDAEGKPYSFDDKEINVIYNMIDDVLEKTKW